NHSVPERPRLKPRKVDLASRVENDTREGRAKSSIGSSRCRLGKTAGSSEPSAEEIPDVVQREVIRLQRRMEELGRDRNLDRRR
ncbi:MAG TPA: hypothetical protein VF580_13930, partial [Thermoanaerobaculia bacterium]